MLTRRTVLQAAAALPLLTHEARALGARPMAAGLTSMTAAAQAIGADERRARIGKAQALLVQQKAGALLVESGASLDYFTGIRWHRSERITAALIPAQGAVQVITPSFEAPSIREMLAVDAEIHTWDEHEDPCELLVRRLREAGIDRGEIAVESTTRFFIIAGLQQRAETYRFTPADAVVKACRMIKSSAELALMQLANHITLAAIRHAHARMVKGMSSEDLAALIEGATTAFGATPEFTLVLLNEASAYPHGSLARQNLREGSTVLVDCGCSVHGYQSDISRSWVFGSPSARQKAVWRTVKRGQERILELAKPGVACGLLDEAVRRFYESEGWGPGYRLPGLAHRAGHGIGLDGHEPPYLVQGDSTPLEVGMCFSNEPGIYIPGEFGVRLEDCWHVTETGAETFTSLAASLQQPV